MIATAPDLLSLPAKAWGPDWPLDALAGGSACAYLWAATRGRHFSPWRAVSFLAGIATVLVALQSGVDAYDERLLSDHMLQHMLLLLPAPLLLLQGRPLIVAVRALPPGRRATLARALARSGPLTSHYACVAVFGAVLLVFHVPAVYDATRTYPLLHEFEHASFLASGLLLWWPLLGADPARSRRLHPLARFVYLLAAMPAMAAIGAWLDRASSPVYSGYATAAHAFGISALQDQAHAGAIMWVGGSSFLIAVGLFVVMSAMSEEERRLCAAEERAPAADRASRAFTQGPR
jgi:putative membrane protein